MCGCRAQALLQSKELRSDQKAHAWAYVVYDSTYHAHTQHHNTNNSAVNFVKLQYIDFVGNLLKCALSTSKILIWGGKTFVYGAVAPSCPCIEPASLLSVENWELFCDFYFALTDNNRNRV